MENKYFPIHTNTACQLKWSWSTIRLYNGHTSSCHRVRSDTITPENFSTFHNTPKKLSDRQIMLNGQWPTGGCEYCKSIEDSGGFSDRMMHLKIPNQTPPELNNNITEINVTPTIVEVYFDNVCNMSCLYCSDLFSSKIQQENQKFGRFEKHGVIIENSTVKVPNLPAMKHAFWDWLKLNHDKIKRFHFLGGEPFFQQEFDQMLNFLNLNPSPELEFNIISNLMIKESRFIEQIEAIKQLVVDKKIKRLELTASIDCFGFEQEYVRHGLDLTTWRNNFQHAVAESWIVLNINQTLTGLTIKGSAELLNWITLIRQQKEIGHYFSTVVDSYDFLHPGIFGSNFFDKNFTDMYNVMPSGGWYNHAREYLQGIQKEINSHQREPNKIIQLSIYLDEIDRRRNTNWKLTFPWLERELDSIVK